MILIASVCLSQSFETKQAVDSTDFYVFTEAGGTYIPSITMNNISSSETFSINETIDGSIVNVSGSANSQVSNFVVQPAIGYDFVLGFGYQINSAIGIELEVGYSQTSITSTSYSVSANASITGSVDGTNVTNGTASLSGNTTLNGNFNLTQIPVLIGISAQNRTERFQPMASIGIGVCPTFFSGSLGSASANGSFSAAAPGVSLSGSYSGNLLEPVSISSSNAYPFAFKFKAGFDYALSSQASFGLRAWAMGLANSDFGDQLKSDLYGAIGLNASFKVRF